MKKGQKKTNKKVQETKFSKFKALLRDNDGKLKRTDWIIIGVLVLFYSILAFSNLGSCKNPQTFYQFTVTGDELGIKLDKQTNISKMRVYAGDEVGSYEILISDDDIKYDSIGVFTQDMSFAWDDVQLNVPTQYIKISAKTTNGYIGEIQLYDNYGNKVNATAISESSKLILDEKDTVPVTINYKNSAYFDEIYFARSAYEYVHGIPTNEWVHPPLGKLIMAIPIALFGMNTFAYRLMGVIAGILMIPVLYTLAKNIFKNRKWAILAGLLMTFDCFHFSHTRLGTVDSFLVLFIMLSSLYLYKYIDLDIKESFKKKFKYIALSGLFIGCAIATKWTGLYAGLAEAIIFIGMIIYNNYFKNKGKEKDQDLFKIFIVSVIFFIVLPILIYVLSYLLFPTVYPGKVNGINGILNQTKEMFNYHNGLQETHPFQSKWYTWPAMIKPVWYYVSYAGSSLKSTIVGIGNPAIWWFGILASVFVLIRAFLLKNKENIFLVLFILTGWLPYAFISRPMFMYHYFPVLPFIMLSIVALVRFITNKLKNNSFYLFYIAIVVLLFACFYPVISGISTGTDYIDSLKWLTSWIF